jgi:hypothetical protein
MFRCKNLPETNFARHEQWAVSFWPAGHYGFPRRARGEAPWGRDAIVLSVAARPSGIGNKKGPSTEIQCNPARKKAQNKSSQTRISQQVSQIFVDKTLDCPNWSRI